MKIKTITSTKRYYLHGDNNFFVCLFKNNLYKMIDREGKCSFAKLSFRWLWNNNSHLPLKTVFCNISNKYWHLKIICCSHSGSYFVHICSLIWINDNRGKKSQCYRRHNPDCLRKRFYYVLESYPNKNPINNFFFLLSLLSFDTLKGHCQVCPFGLRK